MNGDWTAADPHTGPRKLQGSASVSSCRGGRRRALLLPGTCDWSDRPNLHSPVQTVSVLCPIVGRQHTNSAAAASSTASLAQEGTSQRHAHPLRHLTEWGVGGSAILHPSRSCMKPIAASSTASTLALNYFFPCFFPGRLSSQHQIAGK